MNPNNNLINVSLKNKKVVTSNLDNILNEISEEQRNEIESLLVNIHHENNDPNDSKSDLKEGFTVKKVFTDGSELVFYEYGVFLGIVLGRSKMNDVARMMQEYSDCLIINEKIKNFSALYFYRDLDVAFCFDENKTVKEITLGKNFKGMTGKGLKIHDNIAKAIELYGKPKEMEANFINSYTWDNFLIFSEDKEITHMRFNE